MVGACSGSAIEKSDGVIKVATPAYIGTTPPASLRPRESLFRDELPGLTIKAL